MKLRKGILCYIVAFNMARKGICPFEKFESKDCQLDLENYEGYEDCKKCVDIFFKKQSDEEKNKFIIPG